MGLLGRTSPSRVANKPVSPYNTLQTLEVVNIYFAVAYLEKPDEPVCNWLFEKLGSMTNAALIAQALKDSFYPMEYAYWTTRKCRALQHLDLSQAL